MKNTKIILGLIILLGVFSFGIFYMNKSSTGPSVGQAPTSLSNPSVVPQVAVISIKHPYANSASAALAGIQEVDWQTAGYPANIGVDVNLIKKTSDSPASYSFVRTIASNTPNTGSLQWTPKAGELDSSMYIEVTCTTAHKFDQGCTIHANPIPANQ